MISVGTVEPAARFTEEKLVPKNIRVGGDGWCRPYRTGTDVKAPRQGTLLLLV